MTTASVALAQILLDHAEVLEILREHFLEGSDVSDPMTLSDEDFRNLCYEQCLCGDVEEEQAHAWEGAIELSRRLLAQTDSVEGDELVAMARRILREADVALSDIYNRAFVG